MWDRGESRTQAGTSQVRLPVFERLAFGIKGMPPPPGGSPPGQRPSFGAGGRDAGGQYGYELVPPNCRAKYQVEQAICGRVWQSDSQDD
jgi:hypothetical protein